MLLVVIFWMLAFVVGWFFLYRLLIRLRGGWIVAIVLLAPMFWFAHMILPGLLSGAGSNAGFWPRGGRGDEALILCLALGVALWFKARFARRCLDDVLIRWDTMLAEREGEGAVD